jgi:hypothetical protein
MIVSSTALQVAGKSKTATLLSAIFNISGRGIVTAPKALASSDTAIKTPANSSKIRASRLPRLSLVSILINITYR